MRTKIKLIPSVVFVCSIMFFCLPQPGFAKNKKTKLIWSKATSSTPGIVIGLSTDGKSYLSAKGDKIVFRNKSNNKPFRTITCGKGLVTKLSRDGKLFAKAKDTQVDIFSADSGKMISSIKKTNINHTIMAFSPDNNLLATGSKWTKLLLWDVKTGKLYKELAPSAKGWEIIFSPDGKYLVSGGSSNIHVWEVDTGKLVSTLKPYDKGKEYDANSDTHAIVFSPDGKYLVTGGLGRIIRIWDTSTWELKSASTPLPCVQTSISISPDNTILATNSCNELVFVSMKNAELIQKSPVPGVYRYIRYLEFLPNGKEVFTVTDTATRGLWRLE